MRIPQSYIQKCKVVTHTFQALFVFVALCLTIAVMIKDGETGGPTRFFLAMVSIIIPGKNHLCTGEAFKAQE